MKSKLDELRTEEATLAARLASLDAARVEIRKQATDDPLHIPPGSAQKLAQLEFERGIVKEKIELLKAAIKAEEKRILSPEVQKGIKQAEKIASETKQTCKNIGDQLIELIETIKQAQAENDKAAQLLQTGGRDNTAFLGSAPTFLQHTQNNLNKWFSGLGPEVAEFVKRKP